MIRLISSRLALLVMALLAPLLSAPALADAGLPHVQARLLAASTQPRAGDSIAIGLAIDPGNGWHIYWQNPGETGYAPRITWQLSSGLAISPLRHPAPQRIVAAGSAVNVHAGPVVLLGTLAVPATARAGTLLEVAASADLLVCSDSMCVPQLVAIRRMLHVGTGAPGVDAPALSAAATYLPRVLPGTAEMVRQSRRLLVHAVLPPPEPGQQLAVFAPDASLGVPGAVRIDPADPGILDIDAGSLQPVRRLDLLVTEARPGQPPAKSFLLHAAIATAPAIAPAQQVWPFVAAILGALVGGLLLNLMPCVFPILSLKAITLIRAGTDPREARSEALGYLLGAVAVMLGLGAAVVVLRAGGSAAGWAFQLQDPRIVALLLVLVTAIATNLAGLFELPSLPVAARQRGGFLGGIGTGALAAFIATPCTGPFMAGALGIALVLPPLLALLVFASLGFGLALPFLAIGFFEPVRRRLPRPGHWMVTLRHLLSLPMFATALGLAWLLGQQVGINGMTMGLGVALMAATALWWLGLRQRVGKRGGPALVAVAMAFAVTPLLLTGAGTSQAAMMRSPGAFVQRWSPARLATLRAGHRPVLVYATADWCLTCKVNEGTSLSPTAVREAFARAGAVMLEADWTRSDPEVSRLLAENQRAGVPLYLWYPAQGSPRVLPQVLTPGLVIGLVQPRSNRS